MHDPVLDTLFLPLDDGLIDWPDSPALFRRARYGAALSGVARDRLVCAQTFRPEYDALSRAGFTMDDGTEAAWPLTLVLPPRQREEYRALLARAVATTAPGGKVLACVSNLEGAKTVENDLKALCGNISSLSKSKCRAFWATAGDDIDADLMAQWQALDAPRPILEGRYLSRPGLFAWDRIDAGSARLIEHLPALSGRGADLGGGFGVLSDAVLRRNPEARIDLYEAEQRALDIARQNLATFGDRVTGHWADVTQGISGPYDFVVSNPPFHTGRADRHDLGQGFIRAAAGALRTGGAFYMVANRHLPYEETLKAAFKSSVCLHEDRDYKVYKGIKG